MNLNILKVSRRYFQDKTTSGLLVFFGLFSLLMIVWMLLRIKASDFPVIVRRGSDFGKSSWIDLYSYPVFIAVVLVVHTITSMRFFEISPKAARLVLALGLGVVLYAARVGLAVINI
jgi:hypothetical protein